MQILTSKIGEEPLLIMRITVKIQMFDLTQSINPINS